MIYDDLYESLIGAKSLRITFDKVDRLIRDYDGTKYLVSFGPEKYDAIESDNDLLLKITLTMHDVVILINSIFNKNHNQYYYKTFLEPF